MWVNMRKGVNFKMTMIKDFFIYIHGTVHERGSDWGKKQETTGPPEIEFKLANVMSFKDVRSMIKRIRISLSLQKINNDIVEELSDLVRNNKGEVNLYIEIKDFFTFERVSLFARQHRIKINSEVYKFLKRREAEEVLQYKVEMGQ